MSNTFAFKDVLDFTVEEYSSTSTRGDILFTAEYATSSNVQSTGERLTIRGGGANYKLIDIDHTRDVMFNSMLPLVDMTALATKLGRTVSTGSVNVPIKETLTASASNEITLTSTPVSGTLKIYKVANERGLGTQQTAGTPASVENEYSISGRTVTLNSTTAPSGTEFFAFYDYASGSLAENVKITADDFPSFITITGRGMADDDQTGERVPVAFKINKAKVKPEFEINMSGTSATELDFSCDCYTVINSDNEREFVDVVKLVDEAV